MALQQDQKQDAEADVEIEVGRFVVQSSVQQQKLFLSLRDKIAKKLYKSSFTSSELQLSGFTESQAQKLETIGRLIQAAQAKQQNCKLDIKIPQEPQGNDEGDGGVQGIMNTITEFRFAEVVIVREDGMFGNVSYKLKLDEVTRDAVDVNKDYIDDIKEDVNYMREQIDQLTADLSLARQHTLPKGSIIEWYGARNNIPKFWEIHEIEDDIKGDEEEEENAVAKDIFTYESDFDENGIIFALGSAYGTQDWQNPSLSGLVEIRTAARMGRVSKPKDYLINRDTGIMSYVTSAENNWFMIDFKNIKIRPTNYTLRHDAGPTNEDHLRNWQLQGNNDGYGNWIVLIDHQNDESLNEPDGTSTWTIPNITRFYRYFRVALTGPTSNGRSCICCSGFEIYGEIQRLDEDNGAQKKRYTLIKTV